MNKAHDSQAVVGFVVLTVDHFLVFFAVFLTAFAGAGVASAFLTFLTGAGFAAASASAAFFAFKFAA